MHANASPEQDVVIAETEIAAPPERVFKALTDSVETRQWGSSPEFQMTEWEMDLRVGGKMRFVSKETDPAAPYSSRWGVKQFEHHGEILELDRPNLLVYTWLTNFHENPNHPTVVRWKLTPTATGTRVNLTHSGLAAEPKAREDYRMGWVGMLQAVKAFAEGAAR